MVNHLRLLGTTFKPWIIIKSKNDCEGIQCDLIKYLSRSLNFTFEFIEQAIGTGRQLPNGSWTGCIGRIERDEADMTAFPIAMNKAKVVDQSSPYYIDKSLVLIRFDQSWTRANFNKLDILDIPSWSLFLTLFISISSIIIMLDDNFLINKEQIFQRISKVIFSLIGTFLENDIQIERKIIVTISSLILMSSWLISANQLSMAISSEITARFSLKIPCKQINTLKELVDSKISLIVFETFFHMNKIEDKDVLNKIKSRVNEENTMVKIVEMLKNKKYILDTSEGRSAIFLGATTLKILVNIHSKHLGRNTKFRFLDENFRNPFLYTIAISTRLPKKFRIKLNLRISQYLSAGLINVQLDHTLALSVPLFDYKPSVYTYFEPISLDIYLGLFKIILIFWAISLNMFIFENIVYSLFI